jgi:hypothetical protein
LQQCSAGLIKDDELGISAANLLVITQGKEKNLGLPCEIQEARSIPIDTWKLYVPASALRDDIWLNHSGRRFW